jgi:2-polyprenyl-3-methyl-5-hydroxy-6-metoxy-1,4-benzoquinol methylase
MCGNKLNKKTGISIKSFIEFIEIHFVKCEVYMREVMCTLCGSNKCEIIDTLIRNDINNEYSMYKCLECETHFIYPMPEQEKLEQYYDGTFRKEVHSESYYSKGKLDTVFNSFLPEAKKRVVRVADELEANDDILEIGCSVGYFLFAIADKVKNVYGTEWDSSAVAYINDSIECKNLKVAKNPEDFNRKFDKIFMFHVLEHIEQPIQFLSNLKSLLNENGKIYIEVPNADDILVKTFHCHEFMNRYYKKAHLYNFNEKGLSYVFQQAGYHYDIDYVQRYDISNHFYWLVNGKPGGNGAYKNIFPESLNNEYVKALISAKQADTLFARIWTDSTSSGA